MAETQSVSRAQRRRTRLATTVFCVVVALAGLLVTGASAVRRNADPPLRTVVMAGSSEFLGAKNVQDVFQRYGIQLEQDPLGSQQIASQIGLAKNFEIANTGSLDAAQNVERRLATEGVNGQSWSPFSSPMVIVTYRPILQLLEQIHLVKQEAGIYIFDIRAYLNVLAANMRWTDIPGNTTYPSAIRILVWTTDPQYSNSGGMFAAIISSAQLNDDPVTEVRPGDQYLVLTRKAFTEQGSMSTHTPSLLDQFLTDGMRSIPMAMFYEKDYFNAVFNEPDLVRQRGLVAMYPNPDVIADNTFVAWDKAGAKVSDILTHDPDMIAIEEHVGYRTSGDNISFVGELAARGVTVPDLNKPPPDLQIVPLPTDAVLQQLIDAIKSS